MTWQQRRIAQLEDKAVRLMQIYERFERLAATKTGEERAALHSHMAEVSLSLSTTEASIKRLVNNTPI